MFDFKVGAFWVNQTRPQLANKWKQSAIQKQNSFDVQAQLTKLVKTI